MIKEGFDFSFDESGCAVCGGYCCVGEPGYVWLSLDDIEAISNFLRMDRDSFLREYCLKVGYKYSLKEKDASDLGSACIFFDVASKKCQIYELRPKQCRDFPFWDSFKRAKDEVYKECPYVRKL